MMAYMPFSIAAFSAEGVAAMVVGEVVDAGTVGGARYVEGPLGEAA